ncbi:MAG: hypothetical protein H6710_18075 [Myxococcales bacterium]|nr:hypothetical protein [Myxococcales bacterium]
MPRRLGPLLLLPLVAALAGSGSTGDTGETAASATTGSTTGSTGTSGSATASATESSATGSGTAASTGAGTEGETEGGAIDYGAPGPHPVGNRRFTLPSGDRTLLVEVWYPADASAKAAADAGRPIADFVPAGPDRDAFEGLLGALSPAGKIGTRLQTRSAEDAALAAGGPWPLLVFSHCHNCLRFSAFSLAEHLASHGFVVAAPDHTGNTLFDELAGMSADLSDEFLVIRRGDLQALLDALLGDAPEVPAELHGALDPARVGAFGHSYGAATVGRLLQDDPRPLAGLPLAAPVQNPIFPGTMIAAIDRPMLFVLAEEDNSISIIGNNLIRQNFKDAAPPSWLVEVRDAGHWNFSDICGLTDAFAAGCGDGERMAAPHDPFTYLDIDVARGLASAYALAFFDLHLRGNAAAADYLATPEPAEWVTVSVRE